MLQTRRQQAYDWLREQMRNGKLAPGDRLGEIPLSREMCVSRGPLREAINQLASEGLVHQTPGLGACVRSPDEGEIREIYETREALEAFAASKAAGRILPQQLDTLQQHCDTMHALLRQYRAGETWGERHRQALLDADTDFHALIAQMSQNARIAKLLDDFRLLQRMLAYKERLGSASNLATRSQAWSQHVRILRALRRRNGEAAGRLMAEHVRTARRNAMAAYTAMQRTSTPAEADGHKTRAD